MRKNNRKDIEIFNLSFLDVISCGFGAIILLLVISKISQPVWNKESNQQASIDLTQDISQLETELKIIQDETQGLETQLKSSQQQMTVLKANIKTKLAGLTQRLWTESP